MPRARHFTMSSIVAALCGIALAAALVALSRFAAGHAGRLHSAELNPVVVLPEGRGLVALDALIVPKA